MDLTIKGASAIAYDGNRATAVLTTPEFSVAEKVEIVIKHRPGHADLLDAAAGKLARLRRAMQMVNAAWPKDWSPDSLVKAAQTGERLRLHPETAVAELETLQQSIPQVVQDINAMDADRALIERALRHLGGLYAVEIHHTATAK